MRRIAITVISTSALVAFVSVPMEARTYGAATRRCGGKAATIVGNGGSNRLTGTGGADVIWAGRGDDKVRGGGGNDTICGNGGSDTLVGGAGNDKLIGGPGSDTCKPGPGQSSLSSCETGAGGGGGGEGDGGKCHASYPDFCIPPPPPDLDCADVAGSNFTVKSPDPHGFDGDHDGVGCES